MARPAAALPATITTTESFPANTPTTRLDFEVQMRLRANAIRCTYSRARNLWIMVTEWNVFGGNR
jgi:hypothetical protein